MRIPRTIVAALLLAGTIIGVGMFALPYVFARAGFLPALVELAVLAGAVVVVHLAYADVVAASPVVHRLPGYAARVLGPAGGAVATLSAVFGIGGTLLAYVVLGGAFLGIVLEAILPRAPEGIAPLLFFGAGVAVLARGVRFENAANAAFSIIMVLAVLGLVVWILPAAEPARLLAVAPGRIDIPYGVVLFSLAGATVIPNMRELFRPREAPSIRRAAAIGTIIPAALYAVFVAAVVAATGSATTPDAVGGLAALFGPRLLILGGVIGFLATFTSFVGIGGALEESFVRDFRIRRLFAWVATAAIPLGLFLAGFQDFIRIIGLVGAVAIGVDSILILLIHRRLERERRMVGLRLAPAVRALLILMFLAGAVQEALSVVWGF